MKILTVHNRYQQPGGEDVVFAREAALLREYGHEVVEYVDDNKHIAGQHRLTVALESVWSRPTYQRLLQILLKLRPDIVHFHNTFVRISASAYAACRAAGVPVVQTLHNYRSVCPAATLFRQGQVCEDCVGTRLSWPSVRNGCYHGSRLQTAVVAGVLGVQRWYRALSEPVDVYAALTHFAKRKLIAGGLCADRIVVKPNFVADPGVRTQSVRTQSVRTQSVRSRLQSVRTQSVLRVSALRVSALRVSALRVSALRVSALRVSALRVSALRVPALRVSALRSVSQHFL